MCYNFIIAKLRVSACVADFPDNATGTTSGNDEDLSKAIFSTTEHQALDMFGNY